MQKLKKELNANNVGVAAHSDPLNQKGITLIALIITIIVMLILVGVTINVALNGGLFDKADKAKKGTILATEKEQLLDAVLGTLDNNGKINLNQIILPNGFKKVSEDNSKVIYEGPSTNQYKVDKGNGEIEEVPENEKVTPTPPNEENDILGLYGNKAINAIEILEDGTAIFYSNNVAEMNAEYEITGTNAITITITDDGTVIKQDYTYEVIRNQETNEIINKIIYFDYDDGVIIKACLTTQELAGFNNSLYDNKHFVSQNNMHIYFHEGWLDYDDGSMGEHNYFVYNGYIWSDEGVFYIRKAEIKDDGTFIEDFDMDSDGLDIYTEVK